MYFMGHESSNGPFIYLVTHKTYTTGTKVVKLNYKINVTRKPNEALTLY